MQFVKHDRRLVDELEGGRWRSQSAIESTSPLMEPVPDGPLIAGCSSTSSSITKRLSGKVMNRLRKSSDSTIPSFDRGQDKEEEQCVGYDPFPYTKTVGYRSENGHLTDRLRHMSRASKERLTELARSFSSRRNDRSLYYPSSTS